MATKILDASFQRAGHFRASYEAIIPAGMALKDVLSPEFWANTARRMRQFDIIAVMPEDGAFYAELIVQTVGTGFAKVAVVLEVQLDADSEGVVTDKSVIVKWRGPSCKFGVVRTSDKMVLREGFDDKDDAERWAADHLKAMAR